MVDDYDVDSIKGEIEPPYEKKFKIFFNLDLTLIW